jgi:hypothetical protein
MAQQHGCYATLACSSFPQAQLCIALLGNNLVCLYNSTTLRCLFKCHKQFLKHSVTLSLHVQGRNRNRIAAQ